MCCDLYQNTTNANNFFNYSNIINVNVCEDVWIGQHFQSKININNQNVNKNSGNIVTYKRCARLYEIYLEIRKKYAAHQLIAQVFN